MPPKEATVSIVRDVPKHGCDGHADMTLLNFDENDGAFTVDRTARPLQHLQLVPLDVHFQQGHVGELVLVQRTYGHDNRFSWTYQLIKRGMPTCGNPAVRWYV